MPTLKRHMRGQHFYLVQEFMNATQMLSKFLNTEDFEQTTLIKWKRCLELCIKIWRKIFWTFNNSIKIKIKKIYNICSIIPNRFRYFFGGLGISQSTSSRWHPHLLFGVSGCVNCDFWSSDWGLYRSAPLTALGFYMQTPHHQLKQHKVIGIK